MPARYVVNCSILLTEHPLLHRPQAARDAGFEAIEFWWPFTESVPADAEVDAFVRAVANAGVRLVALNFAGGDMAAGERGLLSVPGRGQEFRDNVDVAVGIAERLGTRHSTRSTATVSTVSRPRFKTRTRRPTWPMRPSGQARSVRTSSWNRSAVCPVTRCGRPPT